MPLSRQPSGWGAIGQRAIARIEQFLEDERDQLAPWLVVFFGVGIAAWFALPGPAALGGLMLLAGGTALGGLALRGRRLGQCLVIAGLALAAGAATIAARSAFVAAPRLDRPTVIAFEARVEAVEARIARGQKRLTLDPIDPGLPRVRVTIPAETAPDGLSPGARIALRARLMPPPDMALPGSHDFARDAYFRGLGGVGRALGPVTVITPGSTRNWSSLRARLAEHIGGRMEPATAGIAIALATGDQSGVTPAIEEDMRRSGLAHLLSVSGLHIAAVVGAAMMMSMRLLALSQRAALGFNLVLVSAAVGAMAGIAYTLMTGMQVPTVRSCLAALLVLLGIAAGREALSIRLVAVGALVVLLFRPEALMGASFQMSFAAVTVIVTLHNSPRVRRLLAPRDTGMAGRLGRSIIGLVLTGLAVEIALIPIGLYHFHKAGLYGVAANLVAIPMTTFVTMPAEALALLLDSVGIGAPAWYVVDKSIAAMLWIAALAGQSRGAVAALPAMPGWAFGAMVAGGLWFCLWQSRARWAGLVPAAVGAVAAITAPTPDLLITGDGRHLAVVAEDGTPYLLRERSGGFTRGVMAEAAGFDGDLEGLTGQRFARCGPDSCTLSLVRSGRAWSILATRSGMNIHWPALIAACAASDIVVSDRRLPRACRPRWLKLDRAGLAGHGGMALYLTPTPGYRDVATEVAGRPWREAGDPFSQRR